ncbi:Hypothetical protein CINCED_3A010537 [Cinara cedri]|uniref:Uncharacterized protein n=1 Tax=Cinara cedri TaxID=506608 RepID=A0A5E4MJU4_9HEMI|nr:Hypothetical protein CINCED_3A010537 [Cinara cedri]
MDTKNIHKNTAIKYPNERHYIRPSKKMQTAMVDDDLLEFLVRVADNPAEWNKIQRVLNMLGREEMGMPEGSDAVASTSPTIITTSMTGTPETMVPTPPQKVTAPVLQLQQLKTTPQTVTSSSWPSGDWILEVVEKIRATAKARRKGTGSDAEDTYDYDEDDGGDDEDDYSNDEIEEIEEPAVAPTDASIVPATAHSPPPQPPRLMAGHMSRYQFKRIDGRPDDGRVNGTYVAVVESDRPSRGVIYDPFPLDTHDND